MATFCQRLYHRKCIRRGVGGEKKPKWPVNVVCERTLSESFLIGFAFFELIKSKQHYTLQYEIFNKDKLANL